MGKKNGCALAPIHRYRTGEMSRRKCWGRLGTDLEEPVKTERGDYTAFYRLPLVAALDSVVPRRSIPRTQS